jgi:hypothetical protein
LEELHFRSDPETLPSDLQCLDLYLWRVSEHLEASFSRAELSRVQSSSGVHHLVEDFRSTGFESGFGDSGTWVVLTITRSIFGIFLEGDWTSLAAWPNY